MSLEIQLGHEVTNVTYKIQFKPKAIKDLQTLTPELQKRIIVKIEGMQNNLQGYVKRLANFTPEYRLRVGDYRVLFAVEEENLVIYRVKHRSKSYNN